MRPPSIQALYRPQATKRPWDRGLSCNRSVERTRAASGAMPTSKT
ncbi:hypothetical protein HMPREF0762_01146 [Slackia exigua ATCC 700122]|uniref:Uncharacterized protein n=1 Tax=Slackia exigua (strain ATCC 700122 / DSM 15923 / CIP 105133 / JCM 11022 / KCTC 5966 / S-7) TaxID=649764 RepID=D0WHB4_SLAES|nr:hypothetical protein HMPREF0762_01146 [Slackia exigua ATCC 700122]